MSRTVALRYSNMEGPTIPLHEALLGDGEFAYWGWWKKTTEPFPRDVLVFVRDNATSDSPLRIGLLNRKDDEYYVAHCIGVEFSDDGSEMDCPDKPKCPEYYREKPLAGWFKVAAFERSDEARYSLEFGPPPQLDPTLYDVVRTAEGFEVLPKPMWTMEPVRTGGSRILHISDLHFGAYHGFPDTDSGAGPGQRSLKSIFRDRLARLEGSRVGVVVVSGDLISLGQADGFPAAKTFIDGVLEVLELERQHVIIVPGNHDIWLEDAKHPTRDYAHEEPYRDFLAGFYLREFQDLEWIQRFDTGEWDLIFVTLNSARLRTEEIKEYGYVGAHRYEQMLQYVLDTIEQKPKLEERQLLVAVVHHHLLPVPLVSMQEQDRPVSLSLDAGQLLSNFQQYGVRVVLHGHQHVPFMSRSVRMGVPESSWPTDEIVVLGGGSAGAAASQLLSEAPFNTYSTYEPTEQGLHLLTEKYTSMAPPSPLFDVVVPFQ